MNLLEYIFKLWYKYVLVKAIAKHTKYHLKYAKHQIIYAAQKWCFSFKKNSYVWFFDRLENKWYEWKHIKTLQVMSDLLIQNISLFIFTFLRKMNSSLIVTAKSFWLITYHSKTQLMTKAFFLQHFSYTSICRIIWAAGWVRMYWKLFCVSSVICIELPFIFKGCAKTF